MSGVDHARMMLASAKKDFTAIQGMTDPVTFDESIFGFHVQQAVEKTVKAWLSFLGKEYPKTHDLRFLLAILAEEGVDVGPFENFIGFNAYAVQFRYENYEMPDEGIDRQKAIQEAGQLIRMVEDLL